MEKNEENRYKVVDITKPDSQDYDDSDSIAYPIAAVVGSGVAIAAIALLVDRLAIGANPATIIGCISTFGFSAYGAGVSFEQIVKSIAKKTVYENTTKLEEQIAELEAELAESGAKIAELENNSRPKGRR